MMENQFIGTWQLISWEFVDNEGFISYPKEGSYDNSATGYLMYTQEGYMSVVIMTTANRPKFKGKEFFEGDSEEKIAAADTYISYCGKYEIQADKVIHHVEASLFPNEIGTDLERSFEFNKNQLSLTTTPFVMDDKQQVVRLVWARVENMQQ
jgi:hypothetical protein